MDNQKMFELLMAEIRGVKEEMNVRFGELDSRLGSIEGRQDEMYRMLRALEKGMEVNKATLDSIKIDIAELKGKNQTLEKVAKQNSFDIAELKYATN